MKSGVDVWYCYNCEWNGKIEDAQPGQPCPRCEQYSLNADYPASRVRGERFTPYQGNSHWVNVANRAMADAARSNFERALAR